MVRKLVVVDAWQQQCCGPAIVVGGHVDWAVLPPDRGQLAVIVGDGLAGQVDGTEDHHSGTESDGARSLAGLVRSIRLIYCRYEWSEARQHFVPVPDSGRLVYRRATTTFEAEPDGMRHVGYLVEVDEG